MQIFAFFYYSQYNYYDLYNYINIMSTKNLQKQFSKTYQDFFSKHELVLSAHFGFHRFPSGANHITQYVWIKQKVKSKCYVWIKRIPKRWLYIENIEMYNGEDFVNYDKEKIKIDYSGPLGLLQGYMSTDKEKHWYSISIVSESMRGEWLWFTGTIFTLIVAALGIMTGKYKSTIFDNYETFKQSSSFKDIKTIAHQCTQKFKQWNIGSSFYTALLNTPHPHVYLSEECDLEKIDDLPHIKEYYSDLVTLAKVKNTPFPTLPIRRAMIYTWQRANPLFVERNREFTKKQNDDYSVWFEGQNWDNTDTYIHKMFKKKPYHNTMLDTLNAMSVKTLYLLTNVYKHWPRADYVDELKYHFNTINSIYNDLEHDFDITSDFVKACVRAGISPQNFWYFPIYTAKYGGNYLVIFEDDSDMHMLKNVVENMKKTYPEIRISHIYDFDNPASNGIKVEQNIYEEVLSKHTEGSYIIVDNKKNQSFCHYADIVATETKGLFLDAIKNKIYLNGKALTSNDIKSQTTTIEIFEQILQNPDFRIKNNELWPSTFSSQQNQMLWKIIYPLNKLVERETGEFLNLESTWSLREFWITLWKTKVPISLVKKIT